MMINGLSDAELLERGCYWKIGTVRETGRFGYARPIVRNPGEYFVPVVTPKFWLPKWCAVLLFRCLRISWQVDREPQVWVALAGDNSNIEIELEEREK